MRWATMAERAALKSENTVSRSGDYYAEGEIAHKTYNFEHQPGSGGKQGSGRVHTLRR